MVIQQSISAERRLTMMDAAWMKIRMMRALRNMTLGMTLGCKLSKIGMTGTITTIDP